jgi:hypothetical protein
MNSLSTLDDESFDDFPKNYDGFPLMEESDDESFEDFPDDKNRKGDNAESTTTTHPLVLGMMIPTTIPTTTTHPLLGMDRRGRTHYPTVLQAVTKHYDDAGSSSEDESPLFFGKVVPTLAPNHDYWEDYPTESDDGYELPSDEECYDDIFLTSDDDSVFST